MNHVVYALFIYSLALKILFLAVCVTRYFSPEVKP